MTYTHMYGSMHRFMHARTHISCSSVGIAACQPTHALTQDRWHALSFTHPAKGHVNTYIRCFISQSLIQAHAQRKTHTHKHTNALALWLFQRYNEIIVASQLNGPTSQNQAKASCAHALRSGCQCVCAWCTMCACVSLCMCVHECVSECGGRKGIIIYVSNVKVNKQYALVNVHREDLFLGWGWHCSCICQEDGSEQADVYSIQSTISPSVL